MNQPRKTLRVVHCYSGNLYGGIERMLATLARCGSLTPEVTHEFALVFPGKLHDELVEENARVSVVGPTRLTRPWTVRDTRRRFREELLACRPDVVVCHSSWPHVIFAPEVRFAGLPLVLWVHDASAGRHPVDRLASFRSPDAILTNSEFTARTLEGRFIGVPRVVAYYPVAAPAEGQQAASVRRSIRRELGTPETDVVVAITCRLEAYKGHELLLESLSVLGSLPGWRLWIAGGVQRSSEQEFLRKLRTFVNRAGISDRVSFLGQRDDVSTLLAAADIHCQPNLRGEPFGIAFIEALYAGLPVVTTRIGGATEILDDACGMLVRPDDPEALATALRGLIVDPVARRHLGSRGAERAAALCGPSTTLPRIHAALEATAARQFAALGSL